MNTSGELFLCHPNLTFKCACCTLYITCMVFLSCRWCEKVIWYHSVKYCGIRQWSPVQLSGLQGRLCLCRSVQCCPPLAEMSGARNRCWYWDTQEQSLHTLHSDMGQPEHGEQMWDTTGEHRETNQCHRTGLINSSQHIKTSHFILTCFSNSI